MSISTINPSLASNLSTTSTTATAAASGDSVFGEIWDTINPLQHIPLVSSIYRAATDTSISSFANIAGSTIYGGPIGGAVAAVEEGVSAIGSAIFGDSKTATAAAAKPTDIEPAAGAKPATVHHHHKLHAATQDWLYQNLNDTTDTITESADTTNISLATTAKAGTAYQKIQGMTTDWLNSAISQKSA